MRVTALAMAIALPASSGAVPESEACKSRAGLISFQKLARKWTTQGAKGAPTGDRRKFLSDLAQMASGMPRDFGFYTPPLQSSQPTPKDALALEMDGISRGLDAFLEFQDSVLRDGLPDTLRQSPRSEVDRYLISLNLLPVGSRPTGSAAIADFFGDAPLMETRPAILSEMTDATDDERKEAIADADRYYSQLELSPTIQYLEASLRKFSEIDLSNSTSCLSRVPVKSEEWPANQRGNRPILNAKNAGVLPKTLANCMATMDMLSGENRSSGIARSLFELYPDGSKSPVLRGTSSNTDDLAWRFLFESLQVTPGGVQATLADWNPLDCNGKASECAPQTRRTTLSFSCGMSLDCDPSGKARSGDISIPIEVNGQTRRMVVSLNCSESNYAAVNTANGTQLCLNTTTEVVQTQFFGAAFVSKPTPQTLAQRNLKVRRENNDRNRRNRSRNTTRNSSSTTPTLNQAQREEQAQKIEQLRQEAISMQNYCRRYGVSQCQLGGANPRTLDPATLEGYLRAAWPSFQSLLAMTRGKYDQAKAEFEKNRASFWPKGVPKPILQGLAAVYDRTQLENNPDYQKYVASKGTDILAFNRFSQTFRQQDDRDGMKCANGQTSMSAGGASSASFAEREDCMMRLRVQRMDLPQDVQVAMTSATRVQVSIDRLSELLKETGQDLRGLLLNCKKLKAPDYRTGKEMQKYEDLCPYLEEERVSFPVSARDTLFAPITAYQMKPTNFQTAAFQAWVVQAWKAWPKVFPANVKPEDFDACTQSSQFEYTNEVTGERKVMFDKDEAASSIFGLSTPPEEATYPYSASLINLYDVASCLKGKTYGRTAEGISSANYFGGKGFQLSDIPATVVYALSGKTFEEARQTVRQYSLANWFDVTARGIKNFIVDTALEATELVIWASGYLPSNGGMVSIPRNVAGYDPVLMKYQDWKEKVDARRDNIFNCEASALNCQKERVAYGISYYTSMIVMETIKGFGTAKAVEATLKGLMTAARLTSRGGRLLVKFDTLVEKAGEKLFTTARIGSKPLFSSLAEAQEFARRYLSNFVTNAGINSVSEAENVLRNLAARNGSARSYFDAQGNVKKDGVNGLFASAMNTGVPILLESFFRLNPSYDASFFQQAANAISSAAMTEIAKGTYDAEQFPLMAARILGSQLAGRYFLAPSQSKSKDSDKPFPIQDKFENIPSNAELRARGWEFDNRTNQPLPYRVVSDEVLVIKLNADGSSTGRFKTVILLDRKSNSARTVFMPVDDSNAPLVTDGKIAFREFNSPIQTTRTNSTIDTTNPLGSSTLVEVTPLIEGVPTGVGSTRITKGATTSYLVKYSDGSAAIFKSDGANSRTGYLNEVAAYEVDRMLGLGLVPVTVRRKVQIDGKPVDGSLQLFVQSEDASTAGLNQSNTSAELRFLDGLIGMDQAERWEPGNLRVTSSKKEVAVDNERAFDDDFMRAMDPNLRIPTLEIYERLSKLDPNQVRRTLEPLIGKQKTDIFLNRVKKLLQDVNSSGGPQKLPKRTDNSISVDTRNRDNDTQRKTNSQDIDQPNPVPRKQNDSDNQTTPNRPNPKSSELIAIPPNSPLRQLKDPRIIKAIRDYDESLRPKGGVCEL